jgi:hypothetical protein
LAATASGGTKSAKAMAKTAHKTKTDNFSIFSKLMVQIKNNLNL